MLYLTGVIFKADSNLSNLLSMPRGPRCWGRSKLLVGRAVTIKGGRSVKTSPVLPGWAKVLLKRFFWGTLNVVKWSPPQLGHSKRPSLTTRAKQTPSPLPQPCQFPSNPLGLDPVSRYSTTQGTCTTIERKLQFNQHKILDLYSSFSIQHHPFVYVPIVYFRSRKSFDGVLCSWINFRLIGQCVSLTFTSTTLNGYFPPPMLFIVCGVDVA